MKTVSLALRNLTRNKRRNAILAVAIAFGFFVVTAIDGLTTGMVGNLENIGWSKPGHESLYNIYIMEEVQTILAIGAGASTKLVDYPDRLERVFNYKFPLEYNKHFDLMISRKDVIEEFYGNSQKK